MQEFIKYELDCVDVIQQISDIVSNCCDYGASFQARLEFGWGLLHNNRPSRPCEIDFVLNEELSLDDWILLSPHIGHHIWPIFLTPNLVPTNFSFGRLHLVLTLEEILYDSDSC